MSTAVTKTLKKEITEDISKLLGRGKLAFQCPLDPVQRHKFWRNLLQPDTVAAYDLLKEREYRMDHLSSGEACFDVVAGDSRRYSVRFVAAPFTSANVFIKDPRRGDGLLMETEQVIQAFNDDHGWPAFVEWMENCASVHQASVPALKTLGEILEFCGTIGQLVRAAPDLYQYLPKERQDILKEQRRASNMPHEWAGFERARVTNLQFAMAKANLFPKPAKEKLYEEIFETWVTYG